MIPTLKIKDKADYYLANMPALTIMISVMMNLVSCGPILIQVFKKYYSHSRVEHPLTTLL